MNTKDYTLECKEKSEEAVNTSSTECSTPGHIFVATERPEGPRTVIPNNMCNFESLEAGDFICIFSVVYITE